MKSPFDKYRAYSDAVQSPDYEARFLRKVYKQLVGSDPKVLREDFCGTFALCCEWIKLANDKKAIGLDLDPEPLSYGRSHYLPALAGDAQKRLSLFTRNVLNPIPTKADITCALNFSYFGFHDRETLVKYFTHARRSLSPKGIFICDIFGGPDYGTAYTDKKRLPGFTYTFEQNFFDPITNRTSFSIHFHPKGRRPLKNAFFYDWRMWSIPEVRDAMREAGFKDTLVYWEGTARNGRGSGEFHPRKKGESCSIWVAYVVGTTK
jgi:SAM-dependent methyltransferase